MLERLVIAPFGKNSPGNRPGMPRAEPLREWLEHRRRRMVPILINTAVLAVLAGFAVPFKILSIAVIAGLAAQAWAYVTMRRFRRQWDLRPQPLDEIRARLRRQLIGEELVAHLGLAALALNAYEDRTWAIAAIWAVVIVNRDNTATIEPETARPIRAIQATVSLSTMAATAIWLTGQEPVFDRVAQVLFPAVALAVSYQIQTVARARHRQSMALAEHLAEQSVVLDHERHIAEAAFSAGTDGLIVTDDNLEVLRYNSPAVDLLETGSGLRLKSLLPQVAQARPDTETELTTDNGRTLSITRRALPPGPSDASWLFVIHDLTDARNEERSRIQSQKMAVMGSMAGGVAHEFNNALMVINSSLDMIQMTSDPDERLQRYLTMIAESSDRASALTGQLLSFGRDRKHEIEPTSAARAVQDIASIAARAMNATVETTIDLDSSVAVDVDEQLLKTALLNLVTNARDSMGDSGVVRLRVSAADDTVEFVVSDDGCGIPAPEFERVLEPFYSTKAAARGSGLGLPMAASFAEQSGGDLTIASEVEVGTTVSIILPRSDAVPTEPTPEVAARLDGVSVLIIDDERPVLSLLDEQLQSLGAYPYTASSLDEARELLATSPIDIILCDLALGPESGLELFDELADKPGSPPVVMFSGNPTRPDGTPLEIEVLVKPVSLTRLSHRIVAELG